MTHYDTVIHTMLYKATLFYVTRPHNSKKGHNIIGQGHTVSVKGHTILRQGHNIT